MTPPLLARWLLRAVLPRGERDVILADLDEQFRRDVPTILGARGARRAYWRQALGTVPFALGRRAGPAIARFPSDVHYAVRQWRRRPGFTVAAVLTQATGIAVATAVAAVAHAVLVRPLPYADPDRIVQIFEGQTPPGLLSYRDFLDLRRSTAAFSAVAGYSGGSRTLSAGGQAPERIPMAEVTDGFFELLGIPMQMGRAFTADDTRRGAPPAVILTHAAWQRRFGGERKVLERTITLNGQPHAIVGVLPEEFQFPFRGLAELWLPMRPSPQQEERGYWHWIDVIGRTNPDATAAQVDADLRAVAAGYAARDGKWHATAQLRAVPLRDVLVAPVRPTIHTLLAGVALLMLATCATVAGLLLSRAAARARELSVRAAIGASRATLVRQLLTESLLLSLAGGALGIAGGEALVRSFLASMPRGQRAALPHVESLGIDPAVALFAAGLALLTGLVFGLLPAVRASRGASAHSLREGRTVGGVAEGRLRFGLVTLQMAVAFVLLAGAALLGTSVYRLLHQSPGFDPEGMMTMRLTLGPKYSQDAQVTAFHERLGERLAAIPGVTGVALVSQAPLTGTGDAGTLTVVEHPVPPGTQAPDVSLRTVSSNYFDVMRIPVVGGRAFNRDDRPGTPGVVVVNRELAERLLPGLDPVGKHITFTFAPGPWRIVGVVGDEQVDELDKPRTPLVYWTSAQDSMRAFVLMVRSSQPGAVPEAARAVLAGIDPDLPLFAVRSVEQLTSESQALFMRRAAMWLLIVFATASVLLAAMALYGVLSQAVAERTREIGVRMALGATRRGIFGLMLTQGMVAALAGVVLGVGMAFAGGRLLRALLYGVSAADPLVLGGAIALLLIVAGVASVVPSWRAVRVDPATALRGE